MESLKTSNIRLIKGDCLEVMKDIEDKTIDMILCDLPYGTIKSKNKCKWDIRISLDIMWNEYKRIIKPNGVVALFGCNPFTAKLITSNLEWYRHEWIWHKEKSGNFMNSKFEPMKVHESIVIFGEGKGTYNPIMEKRDEKNRRKNKPKQFSSNIIDSNLFIDNNRDNEPTKFPTSVKYFTTVRGNVHPTQKPTELLEYLVKTYSNEGELVLDNCMGSGSTGVACINTNRNFIGIELDENYYDIAVNRINGYIYE